MLETVKVLGFSGSLRKGSYNTRLLHIAAEKLPPDMTLEIADLSPFPLYNDDIRLEGYPEPVEAFRQKIKQADALLIACPEYNYSVTGVLKNAIDWASRPDKGAAPGTSPLNKKPLGIMGVAGRSGSIRAQLHLRQIAVFVDMLPVNRPEVLISNMPQKVFDEAGNLLDEMAIKLIGDLLVALRDWTRQVAPR